MKELFTLKEVTAFYGISEKSLQTRMRNSNFDRRFEKLHKGVRRLIFTKEDLDFLFGEKQFKIIIPEIVYRNTFIFESQSNYWSERKVNELVKIYS